MSYEARTTAEEVLIEDMTEGMDFLAANISKLERHEQGFAGGLVSYFMKHGQLSAKQLPHAARFIDRLRSLTNPDAPRSTTIDWDTKALWALFTTAYQNQLTWPKIRFVLPSGKTGEVYRSASGERNLVIKLNDWRVAELPRNRPIIWKSEDICKNETRVELKHLFDCENLVQRFASQGRETCNCSFCGLHLTNPQSVVVGYGPICADNWGLPWGEVCLPGEEFTL